MTSWVKIADDFLDDERIEQLGTDAIVLHLSALASCSRRASDGRLPRRELRRLFPIDDVEAAVEALMKAELWRPIGDDNFELVDWSEHLLSREEVEKRRAWSRATSERSRRCKAGDHSLCERCWHVKKYGRVAGGDTVSDGVSDSTRYETIRDETRRSGSGVSASGTSGAASSAGAPLADPTPENARAWLATPLPVFVGDDCPHQPNGWTWDSSDRLKCAVCHRIGHEQYRYDGSLGPLMKTELAITTAETQGRPLSAREWDALAEQDPDGVILVRRIASVQLVHVGVRRPSTADALTADNYWRYDPDRAAAVGEALEEGDDQQ